MSLVKQVSYIGKGSVFLMKRGAAGAKLAPIGNVSSLELSIDEEEKKLQDFESTGGGTLEKVSRVKSVSGKAKTSNHSPANLALALRGSTTAAAAADISAEAHAGVQPGGLTPLARLVDTTKSVTVEKNGLPVSAAGNWEVTAAGLWIYPSATGIVAGDDITVTYSALPENLIQALTASGDEYQLVFAGLNEARSGKPVVVAAHRCAFSPTKGFSLIADDFGELELDFELLSDSAIAGAGLSRFFTVRMAEQAV